MKKHFSIFHFLRLALIIYFLVRIVNQNLLDYDREDIKALITELKAEDTYEHEQFVADFLGGARDYLSWNLSDIPLIKGKKDIFVTSIQVAENYLRLRHQSSSNLSYELIAKAILLVAEAEPENIRRMSVIDIYTMVHIVYGKDKQLYLDYLDNRNS